MDKIPIYVRLLAKLIPVLKYEEGEEENLAKGEIEKFNFIEGSRNKHKFNEQVVGSSGGHDKIWRHVSDDWFKLVGKWPERTC